jgi:hypothetical protein
VQTAYAAIVSSQVQLINILTIEIEQLGEVVAAHFGRHRDAERYLSLPGLGVVLGVVLGAQILVEFGDDPPRYTDAKARRNYAGTSPITRASGSKRVVLARYARNRRLADAVQQWAFCAMRGSPGARAYYQACANATPVTRPPGRPASTRQPPRGHPPRLSQDRHPLQRSHRLDEAGTNHLTPNNMGCLPRVAWSLAFLIGRSWVRRAERGDVQQRQARPP